jgi:hypothetical protein
MESRCDKCGSLTLTLVRYGTGAQEVLLDPLPLETWERVHAPEYVRPADDERYARHVCAVEGF